MEGRLPQAQQAPPPETTQFRGQETKVEHDIPRLPWTQGSDLLGAPSRAGFPRLEQAQSWGTETGGAPEGH